MESHRVTVRMGTAELARLDRQRGGLTRSSYLRGLILDPAAPAIPGAEGAPLSREDVRAILARRARGGSILAIRELQRLDDRELAEAELERLNALTRG